MPAAGTREQQRPAADFQRTLRLDDAADVVGVLFAEFCHHAFLDGVEFAAECVGLFGGQGDFVRSTLLFLQAFCEL